MGSIAADVPFSSGWEALAEIKRSKRDEKIRQWGMEAPLPPKNNTCVKYFPQECGALSKEILQITETPPSLIVKNLQDRTWLSEAVVRAFISRAVIAHHLANPLTEVFFDLAIQRARELDEIYERTGRPVGPLHGFPMSIKDVMIIEDQDTTVGFVAWIGRKRPVEDRLITKLRDAGAVFYCKTNIPQSLMSGECVNYIFGRTSSPWNTLLSAGGSSGGEGSLISLGGSPLGIGTDIAGSIRTPANFNGIYGLCPSPDRFPSHSAENSDASSIIRAVAGPLARSVDGLELYTRTILSFKPWEWDFSAAHIPWRESEYNLGLGLQRPLCFAFMPHDSVVMPDPPIQRGMALMRRALEAAGHQVIDLKPFDGLEIITLSRKIWAATGGEELLEVLSRFNEPLIAEADQPDPSKALSVREYGECYQEAKRIRQKYLDIWQETTGHTHTGHPIDAIILPSGGHVAPPHGTMEYFTYEAISNLLEWTCATIPVTHVDPKVDVKPDARNWEKYTPELYKDGPVCLQVLGQRFTEEKVLGLLRSIDKALGRDEYYMA
ncbi:amidase signature domain-containing protein [Aspergillus germanicus]